MEGWKRFLNKKVKIFCKDVDREGRKAISFKVGILVDRDDQFFYITSKKSQIAIPKSIITRIEVIEDET